VNPTSMRWAFDAGQQHCENADQLVVLLVIADSVTREHRHCVLTLMQMAARTHLPTCEVFACLRSLEQIGLIKPGDQSLVSKYPAKRRPTVWDLALADDSGPYVRGRTTQPMPGAVYRFFDAAGALLYVGSTVDRDLRWAAHRSKPWWPEVIGKTIVWYETIEEARKVERQAITSEFPIYNLGDSPAVPGNGYRVDLLTTEELAEIRRERRVKQANDGRP
jgi:hypothetical protein